MENLDTILFSIWDLDIRAHQIITVLLIVILNVTLFRWLRLYLKPKVKSWTTISAENGKKLIKIIRLFFVFITFLILIYVLKINFNPNPNYLVYFFQALSIIQFARILDWVVSYYFIHRNYAKRDDLKDKSRPLKTIDVESSATKTVQFLVYALAIIIIFEKFNFDFTLISVGLQDDRIFELKLSNLLGAIVIYLIGRLIIWIITNLVLYEYFKQKKIDIGAQYAVNQLVSYISYFIIILFTLSALGINMTLLWGGAAALLVGIGLGLQSTFNDFFSGIVLLSERTVKVGDVVQMEGFVGTIRKIGLRASIVESRDSVSVIVPNSNLVNQRVVNWSQLNEHIRFHITIGVAYGSDTALVKKLLLESAILPQISKTPLPFVRFIDFADSSLIFELYYFSDNLINEHDIKSQIRFKIDELFRINKIKIPFPQTEVYVHQEPKNPS